ncbi:GSCOCG00007279001-RA-CDS [Cotesia congregata]|nr:GSCOCG00007279001-RA-CDS [Cotesia congregata]
MRTFLEQGYFFRINYIQSFLFWLLFMRKGTRVEGEQGDFLISYGGKMNFNYKRSFLVVSYSLYILLIYLIKHIFLGLINYGSKFFEYTTTVFFFIIKLLLQLKGFLLFF